MRLAKIVAFPTGTENRQPGGTEGFEQDTSFNRIKIGTGRAVRINEQDAEHAAENNWRLKDADSPILAKDPPGLGGNSGNIVVGGKIGGIEEDDSSRIEEDSSKNSSKKVDAKSQSTAHNDSEKRYRMNLQYHFKMLRLSVPTLKWCDDNSIPIESLEGLTPPSRVNKIQILLKTQEYIKHLENKNILLQRENEELRRIVLQCESRNCSTRLNREGIVHAASSVRFAPFYHVVPGEHPSSRLRPARSGELGTRNARQMQQD